MTLLIDTDIRLDALGNVEEKVAALNKRAARLELEPLTLSRGPVFIIKQKFRHQGSAGRLEPGFGQARTYDVEMVHIQVRGEPPRLAGWELVAVLENAAGQSVVKTVPGVKDLPALRSLDPAMCRHCNTRRRRNETFVLRHTDGTVTQVGRECLKDFLGNDPAKAVGWVDMMTDLEQLLEIRLIAEEGFQLEMGGGGSKYMGLERFLVACAAAYHANGRNFATRKMVDEGKALEATSDTAFVTLARWNKNEDEGPTDADRELAAKAIAWAVALEPKNDFESNLHIYAEQGAFPWKSAGIAAYVLGAYLREQGALYTKKAQSQFLLPKEEQKHVGTVGERRDFDAVVLGKHAFEGNFGWTYIYRLAIEGSQAVWFASTEQYMFDQLERDERPEMDALYPKLPGPFRITATVKAHDKDRKDPSIPQTVLTRATVWTLPGMAEADAKAAKKAAKAAKAKPRDNPDDDEAYWKHAPAWGGAKSDVWFIQVRGKKDGTMPHWARKVTLHAFYEGSWALMDGAHLIEQGVGHPKGMTGDVPSPEYARALVEQSREARGMS